MDLADNQMLSITANKPKEERMNQLGKIISATIALTALNFVLNIFLCGGIFKWVYQLEPVNVWKSMHSIPWGIYYFGEIIINLIFVLVFMIIKNGLPGKSKISKGLYFGVLTWAIGTLPGMFATYMFMNIAGTVVIYWTLLYLFTNPLRGVLISLICDI